MMNREFEFTCSESEAKSISDMMNTIPNWLENCIERRIIYIRIAIDQTNEDSHRDLLTGELFALNWVLSRKRTDAEGEEWCLHVSIAFITWIASIRVKMTIGTIVLIMR